MLQLSKAFTSIAFLIVAPAAFAQNITGSTSIDTDPNSGMVTATCETDLDADAQEYYQALVNCRVVDGTGAWVAAGQDLDTYEENGYALVVLTFSGIPGTSYTAVGTHSGELYYSSDVPDRTPPNNQEFIDPYNFSSFGEGTYNTYPNFFDWYGPGPQEQRRKSTLSVGSTTDKIAVAPQITLSFIGQKNSKDHKQFSVSGSCKESLGLASCPDGWFWNLEAAVSPVDDASQWTVSQTRASGSYDGYSRNSNGTLNHNSFTIMPGPDGPEPELLQAIAGAKSIFWIDAPGPATPYTDGKPVDSVTAKQTFSASVCSVKVPSVCAKASWFVNIVVTPGGQLSTTLSGAGNS